MKKEIKKFYDEVYNILVEIGAVENMRESFISYHLNEDNGEWRFQGKLGFGGKYYSYHNRVDCYSEDYNNFKILIEETNKKLANLIRPRN